jgi:TOBE-like domain
LEIIPSSIQSLQGVPATISRILALGVTAHIELTNLDTNHPAHFDVEITHDQLKVLGLQEGQTVQLVPSQLKIFKDTHELPTTAHHS